MDEYLSYNGKTFQYYVDKCRYYKGENKVPDILKYFGQDLFWEYERMWVEWHFATSKSEIAAKERFFKEAIQFYKEEIGTKHDYDNSPISLKAFLLSRYVQRGYDGDPLSFLRWYDEEFCHSKLLIYNSFVICCLYFDGSDDYKKGDEYDIIRFYERCWVFDEIRGTLLEDYLVEYKAVGLKDFESDDMVPISLKALLFNRFAKTANSVQEAAEGFKEWYLTIYRPFPKLSNINKGFPEEVRELAIKHKMGRLRRPHKSKCGCDVYCSHAIMRRDLIAPAVGLPEFIIYKDGEAKFVFGTESFKYF